MNQITPVDNPIAEYARAEGIRATELGKRLNVSKGAASELINGHRRVSPDVAQRMEQLTGRPWREFVSPPGIKSRRRSRQEAVVPQ